MIPFLGSTAPTFSYSVAAHLLIILEHMHICYLFASSFIIERIIIAVQKLTRCQKQSMHFSDVNDSYGLISFKLDCRKDHSAVGTVAAIVSAVHKLWHCSSN